MWSTQSDRERAARKVEEERHERKALSFPDETRSVLLRVDYNPREAYHDSDFVRDMVSQGHDVAGAIKGDIGWVLETDGVINSNDVHDVSEVVGMVAAAVNRLRDARNGGSSLTPDALLDLTELELERVIDRITIVK